MIGNEKWSGISTLIYTACMCNPHTDDGQLV